MSLFAEAETAARESRAANVMRESAALAITGGDFIRAAEATVPAVWGEGTAVAWSEGEPLWIVGPPGVGKSTLAQQLVFGRVGLRSAPVLGMPVKDGGIGCVLYVAADRPRQIARSFKRMVQTTDLAALDDGWLRVWRGPLPFDLAKAPNQLANLATAVEATTVVIDSIKDVAPDLSREDVGARVNLALQTCVARRIEVVALHHQRKGQVGNKTPRRLDDVFGSTLMMAGAGSVILLWGEPGATTVELRHLKQPADPVGPWRVQLDKGTGAMTVVGSAGDEDTALRAEITAAVEANPGEGVSALARVVGKRKETVGAVLDALVSEGIVERYPTRKNNRPFSAFRLAPNVRATPGQSGLDGAGWSGPVAPQPPTGAGDGASPSPVAPGAPGPDDLGVGEWDE